MKHNVISFLPKQKATKKNLPLRVLMFSNEVLNMNINLDFKRDSPLVWL